MKPLNGNEASEVLTETIQVFEDALCAMKTGQPFAVAYSIGLVDADTDKFEIKSSMAAIGIPGDALKFMAKQLAQNAKNEVRNIDFDSFGPKFVMGGK